MEGRVVQAHCLRGLHRSSSATGVPNRLGSGHRQLGRRLWDNAFQSTAAEVAEAPWQILAQDREQWRSLEPKFIARITRTFEQNVEGLPPGRQMMPDAGEWTYFIFGFDEFMHALMRELLAELDEGDVNRQVRCQTPNILQELTSFLYACAAANPPAARPFGRLGGMCDALVQVAPAPTKQARDTSIGKSSA